ncbi:hypothetical protein ACSVDA_00040 [Cytobacillus sp. Hm23]
MTTTVIDVKTHSVIATIFVGDNPSNVLSHSTENLLMCLEDSGIMYNLHIKKTIYNV